MHPVPKGIIPGRYALVALVAAFLFFTGVTFAADPALTTRLYDYGPGISSQPAKALDFGDNKIALGESGRALYACQLKVYVVEPVSRYRDYGGHNYEFGFLDFAIDTALNLDYQVPFNKTATWDPAQNGIGTIDGSNIMVIAVIFNHMEGFPQFSYIYQGDTGDPFTAYLADACAAAIPGQTGYNETTGGYTHTVFLEECTWDG
ncbi:MAG TPA: hypothetical protein ENO22_13610 [candidate division Zixibacteria bacterium]|nr:hypothetical protein [candidate division Zixibacteria bacterium]HER00372.1 hypothetical protein [candidate division Zixibacteria bacterium]